MSNSKKNRNEQGKIKRANPASPATPISVVLKPEHKVRIGNGGRVEIGGLRDEKGERFIFCREGSRLVITRLSDWHGGGADASAILRAHGLIIVGSPKDISDAVKQVRHFVRAPIVTKPGWSKWGFALADGRVLVPDGKPVPIMAYPVSPVMLSTSGMLDGWIEQVAAPLSGHLLASFFLMVMFAPALLELTNRSDNFGFELSGEAGKGKTTLLALIASAAGPAIGGGEGTYWRSLNSTTNALESALPSYADMPIVLDEAGLVQGAGKADARANTMREIAFRLSSGMVKFRMGDVPGPRTRTVYLLSTNQPISSLMGLTHGAEADAVADRLMTIPLQPDRLHGTFDFLPPSFASLGAFAASLETAAAQHFGHAMPAYLQFLVNERARDADGLKQQIGSDMAEFMSKAHVNLNDGSQRRVAAAFGLVYAAGRAAKRAGVLPNDFRCGRAALVALNLHRTHGRAAVTVDDRLRAILHHSATIDLDVVDIKSLSRQQLKECVAFLYTGKRGNRELLIAHDQIERVFPDWRTLANDPDMKRRLLRVPGRKTKDRPIAFKGKQRPAYVFQIMDLLR